MNIKIPYGKSFKSLDLNSSRVKGVLRSRIEEYEPIDSQDEIVKSALKNPIGSSELKNLARAVS